MYMTPELRAGLFNMDPVELGVEAVGVTAAVVVALVGSQGKGSSLMLVIVFMALDSKLEAQERQERAQAEEIRRASSANTTNSVCTTSGTALQAMFEPDPVLVAQLQTMGFSENGGSIILLFLLLLLLLFLLLLLLPPSVQPAPLYPPNRPVLTSSPPSSSFPPPSTGSKRAAIACPDDGLEKAVNWCLAHAEDPDFDLPLPSASGGSNISGGTVASTAKGTKWVIFVSN